MEKTKESKEKPKTFSAYAHDSNEENRVLKRIKKTLKTKTEKKYQQFLEKA